MKNSTGDWQWELQPATPSPGAPDGGLRGLTFLEPFKAVTAEEAEDAGGLLNPDELVDRLIADFDAVEIS